MIGDDIVVRVVDVQGDKERGYKVKIGVQAPTSVSFDRHEVRERKLREIEDAQMAALTTTEQAAADD